MNSAAVATAPPVMASITIWSLLLLVAADTSAPVNAPPITAFFCNWHISSDTNETQHSLSCLYSKINTWRKQDRPVVLEITQSLVPRTLSTPYSNPT